MHTAKLRPFFLLRLLLGLSCAAITGACAVAFTPDESACSTPAADPPVDPPTACAEPTTDSCMMYRIQLQGDPTNNVADRAKFQKEFGSACYVAAANNAFNCYFKDLKTACDKGFLVPKIYGAAEYQGTFDCVPDGNGIWSRQVGTDPAVKMYVFLENAPLETSVFEVKTVPMEVNGPYRDLVEVTTVKPDKGFYCTSGQVGADGTTLNQKDWILEVNRKAHKGDAGVGELHSDLAGFTWPCVDEKCKPTMCTEPLVLKEPSDPPVYGQDEAQVHHVVPRKDLRDCRWGTNAYKNAAVISRRLNIYLSNKVPPIDEVEQINKVPLYMP